MFIYCHIDVNECNFDSGGCQQTCTNNVGSFTCSCDSGYELNVDGLNCNGMDIIQTIHIYIPVF